jgi:DNA repair exonuclease SbcCD nuclease subunit
MKVLIYTGYQKVPFNKTTWKEFGTGGTEYSAIKLADYLFSEGHTVIVSGEVISEVANGVIYQNIRELETHQHFDVVIATSYIHYIKLLEDLNITYDKSFFWIHNEAFYPWYNGESLPNNGMDYLTDSRLTKVVAVSHYHKLMLETTYPQIKDKLVVIENAIDPFDWGDIKVKKIENKFIYTSAADRGLSNLLKSGQRLKKRFQTQVCG